MLMQCEIRCCLTQKKNPDGQWRVGCVPSLALSSSIRSLFQSQCGNTAVVIPWPFSLAPGPSPFVLSLQVTPAFGMYFLQSELTMNECARKRKWTLYESQH